MRYTARLIYPVPHSLSLSPATSLLSPVFYVYIQPLCLAAPRADFGGGECVVAPAAGRRDSRAKDSCPPRGWIQNALHSLNGTCWFLSYARRRRRHDTILVFILNLRATTRLSRACVYACVRAASGHPFFVRPAFVWGRVARGDGFTSKLVQWLPIIYIYTLVSLYIFYTTRRREWFNFNGHCAVAFKSMLNCI